MEGLYTNYSDVKSIDKLKQNTDDMNQIKMPIARKTPCLMDVIWIIVSVVITVGLHIFGLAMWNASVHVPVSLRIILLLIPPILAAVNLFLERRILQAMDEVSVKGIQEMLDSRRDQAEQTIADTGRVLRRLRAGSCVLAAVLGVVGLLLALTAAAWHFPIPVLLYAVFLITVSLQRIPWVRASADADRSFVSREDVPYMYALADQAAADLGIQGEMRICLTADDEMGVTVQGGEILLFLGGVALSLLSEQELLAVLHHELSHASESLHSPNDRYASWLMNTLSDNLLSFLGNLFFSCLDGLYLREHTLCRMTTSVLTERRADQAMVRFCDKKDVGSLLTKLFYLERFNWEEGFSDGPVLCASEAPPEHPVSHLIRHTKQRIAARRDVWDGLVEREIQPRNATHPILRKRLEAMGILERTVLEPKGSEGYLRDQQRSVELLDEQIHKAMEETWEADRQENYLEPLSLVKAWEAEGRPLSPEGYRDVVQALQQLGRVTEAVELCRRAEQTLPESAALFACFTLGTWLLRQYDSAGLSYMYRAVDGNHNYHEEGMEEIGAFCCITGDQEELERYRDVIVDLMQQAKDEYSQVGILRRGDALSAEQLPEGVLEDILGHIRECDTSLSLDRIYLVRKTISPTCFTSAFVLRFRQDADPEMRQRLLHQTFLYLDAIDWQYSLFDYDEVKRVRLEAIVGSEVYRRN